MSGWDAPTGSWDSRQEPDESGGPDQQGEPTAGYRTIPGGEGRVRAGRRGLPGYDQAQDHDQAPGQGQPPGYGQPSGYGPGTSSQPGSGPGPGTEQMVRFGQRPAEGAAFGSYPADSGRPGLQDPLAPGSRDEGATGAHRGYGAPDAPGSGWSDAGDQQGYGTRAVYGSPPGYGAQPGSGPQEPAGYQPSTPGFGPPAAGHDYGQDGFAADGPDQGYDLPPGYRQSHGQHAFGPGSFPRRTEQDYQTEAYPQPGAEPSGYPQNGFGHGGFAPDSQPGFGQDAYGQQAYGPAAGAQDGYGPPDHGFQPGYGQPGYPPDGYAQDGYAQDGYAQDGYAQQGFEQPGGPGYDDDFAPDGHPARGRPGPRSPQRPGGIRMALYLAAAVIAVVVIVLVVVNLTKSGTGSTAGGSPTPSTGTGATAAGTGTAPRYVIKLAGNVGTYPLNRQAVDDVESVVKSQSAAMSDSLQSGGAGRATKTVIGIYDLGPVTSIASAAYKGIVFVGYNGTFNPKDTIKVVRAHLVASRVVKAGPHGGDMVCGYNTSTGSDASECVWVTKTTVGAVQFVSGPSTVKYPGASKLAVKVRDAVEVQAQ